MRTIRSSLTIVCALAAAACSSSSGPTGSPPATTPSADAGPAPVASATMNVWLVDRPFGDEAPAAVTGAHVVFDPANGGPRADATSDANGRVVLTSDFSAPGMLTIEAPGHVIVTITDVDSTAPARLRQNQLGKPDGDLVLALGRMNADPAATVKLSGAITNKNASTDRINLGPSFRGTMYDDVGTTYSIRAPKGRPFFLLGSDYTFTSSGRTLEATVTKFFKIDQPALDADTTFDLDVAAAAPVTTVTNHIHLEASTADGGPFAGSTIGAVNVVDVSSVLYTGFIAKAAPSTDGSGFDCDVAVVQGVESPAPLVTQGSIRRTDGAVSLRSELGVLADGATISGFLAPPTVAATTRKQAAAIPLDGIAAEAKRVQVHVVDDSGFVWVVEAPPGTKSITLPAPPPDVTVPATLKGTVVALGDALVLPNGFFLPKAVAVSRTFTLSK